MMWARHSRQNEFLNLQRTVDALSEQLREVQWELQHKNEPFWKSLGFRKRPLNICLRCVIGG